MRTGIGAAINPSIPSFETAHVLSDHAHEKTVAIIH